MDFNKIIDSISLPRLSFYELYLNCSDDYSKLGAYMAFQDLSSEFFSLIQIIEVAFRNVINDVVKQEVGSAWYERVPLSEQSKQSVQEAKKSALKECGAKYTDDDVICRLGLGFWVYVRCSL